MMRDSSGQTVLHHAVKSGSKEIVKYVIENGKLGAWIQLLVQLWDGGAMTPGAGTEGWRPNSMRLSTSLCSKGMMLVFRCPSVCLAVFVASLQGLGSVPSLLPVVCILAGKYKARFSLRLM